MVVLVLSFSLYSTCRDWRAKACSIANFMGWPIFSYTNLLRLPQIPHAMVAKSARASLLPFFKTKFATSLKLVELKIGSQERGNFFCHHGVRSG